MVVLGPTAVPGCVVVCCDGWLVVVGVGVVSVGVVVVFRVMSMVVVVVGVIWSLVLSLGGWSLVLVLELFFLLLESDLPTSGLP